MTSSDHVNQLLVFPLKHIYNLIFKRQLVLKPFHDSFRLLYFVSHCSHNLSALLLVKKVDFWQVCLTQIRLEVL